MWLVAAIVLALAVAGCGGQQSTAAPPVSSSPATAKLPGTGKPAVVIGDKNFTEQFVLGELYREALVAKGFSAQINRNIGPTEVSVQALQSGRLAMYPEYLGVWNSTVAGNQHGFGNARRAYRAGQQYARAHGLRLLSATPFSDVNGIAVTRAYARSNGLRTIGDLATVTPTLTLGGPPQFQQGAAGLPGLAQQYGVVPANFKPIDVGEQYQALDSGAVQAAYVNTTDGQLLHGRYTLLADPRRVFGWGNVVPVIPAKVLAAEGPAFARTIDAVSALLTTRVMRRLNAAVDVLHQDPDAVAKQFLIAHGLATAKQS